MRTAPDDLAERLREAHDELRHLPLGGRGHLVDVVLEAAERVAQAARARVVATYWRDGAMAMDPPQALTSHPCACILEAFEGETDPDQLGVGPGPHREQLEALR